MATRIQGAALVAFSAFSIWLVAAHDYVKFPGGNVVSYVVASIGLTVGLGMLVSGQNPFNRGR